MVKNNINNCKLIDIPKIYDPRGSLSVIDHNGVIPYEIKRVYYLYDIPSGAVRGGHSHRNCQEFLIALSGSFEVILNDGINPVRTVVLNRPDQGLLITTGIWRELRGFSSGSVCLVLASEQYDETDYVRDFDEFMTLAK